MTISVAEPDPAIRSSPSRATLRGRPGCTTISSSPSPCRSSGTHGATPHASSTTGRRDVEQLAWVVDRLRHDPGSRSATITTFEPLLDTSYIPCVSLLDFWAPADALELVVYAHSLDFGKKAYGNLVELTRLQEQVAGELGLPVGRLTVFVKSAHVYEPEWELMARLAENVPTLERLKPLTESSVQRDLGHAGERVRDGQPSFAPSAASANSASSRPGTMPTTVSAIFVIPRRART